MSRDPILLVKLHAYQPEPQVGSTNLSLFDGE